MNNFEQVSDVLVHLQNFHQKLASFYAATAQDVANPRASMLLQTLTSHEDHIQKELANYRESASKLVLNTFFQYSPTNSVEQLFQLENVQQLTTDQIYDLSLGFDNYLADFYDEMITSTETSEVIDLFQNLRDQLEEEKKRLSIDMTALLDM